MGSTVNYQTNPDPRGSWEPQGFLAGFNYQDRLNDYNKKTDLANMNSQLTNEGMAAHNTDFVNGQGARDMGYTQQEGASRNAIVLQPDQLKLGTMQLQGDIQAQPGLNEAKVYESLQALPDAQKQHAMKDTLTAATVLRGLPDGADPALATGILEKLGVDTSRWKGKDPARVQQEFKFLKSLDPKVFEHFNKMEELKATTQSAERIHKSNNDTSRYVADKVAGSRIAAQGNSEAARKKAQDLDVAEIIAKDEEDRTPAENARLRIWQTERQEPNYKGAAAAKTKAQSAKATLDAIQHPEKPDMSDLPPPTTKKGPIRAIEHPTEEQYNQLKDGDPYIYNGTTYYKGRR